ncbi:MAG: ATP-dependent Clp protease proteolytic subunit ClpP, partial [Ilumatobacteraceae bacterium]|nr:ATP-dependent Clp protease proteolytic subunit ClpP [Ilumatobacteraceae bacterium]
GGAQGQSTDMEIAVAEMVEMRRRMVDILIEATGQSFERISTDMDRDFILRGDKAVEYGLVDHIIDRRELANPMLAASPAALPAGSATATPVVETQETAVPAA